MKLIRETLEDIEYLTEADEKTGKKSHYIVGPFMESDVKNRNGRLYPSEILTREVERYNENYIKQNRAFGELGHPDTPTINLDRVSHMIKGLTREGTQFIGKAKIMDTPYGNIVKNLIDEGARLGVSSRGMGSIKLNKEGVNLVQDDFYLATAADIVADPSAPNAFVNGICENKEWVFVNGHFLEVDIDNAKREIRAAPRHEIERVALRLFENFLRKL